jgi:hypothetical protein
MIGRRDPGTAATVGCVAAGAASGIAVWLWLEHRQAFLFLDNTKPNRLARGRASAPMHELLRPVVAGALGVAVFVIAWRLTRGWLNSLPEQKSANEDARKAAAERSQLEASETERKTADAEALRRMEQLAPHVVGSPEWTRIRFRHHLVDVRSQTGQNWERRIWSDARSTKEREARQLMNQLRAEDRDLVAAEALRRKNVARSAAEKAGGISSWRAAELFMAGWMRHRFASVRLTSDGADGGIDIIGSGVVAQVKFESSKTGRPAVQRLKGAAGSNTALFFTSDLSGYTVQAIAWADENDVCLFEFDLAGGVHPRNVSAGELIAGRRTEIQRE